MTELQFDPMSDPPPPEERRPQRHGFLGPLAIVATALIFAVGFWLHSKRASRVPAADVTQAEAAAAPAPEPAVPAAVEATSPVPPPPALEQSDDWLRARVSELFGSAELDRWLASGEGLVGQGVRAIHAISEGRAPRKFLAFVPFEGTFTAQNRGGRWFVAPESGRRFDRIVELFAGLDTARLARLRVLSAPLLSQAMDENAFPGTEFATVLTAAIDHLLATPVPGEALEVVPGEDGVWRYADPRLEGLSPAQKQLLRLGPENGARVRERLADWRQAL